jgi:hypothetical protein
VDWQSLQPPPSAPIARPGAATTKERAVANVYTKALASPSFAILGPALDEEAHFTFVGSRDAHGREEVVKAHDALFGAFEQRSFVPTRVLLTDSSQVLEWTMTGVHKASRKPVTIKGLVLLWTKDDGTISDVHLYFDEAVVKAQRGEGPTALQGLPPVALPSQAPAEVEQARSPEETANVALVRAEVQALEDNKEATYVATMTDDVEVTTLESAAPSRGKAGARAYFAAMRKAIGYLDTSIDNAWGVGPFVAVGYQILGEQRGPIGWIPVQKDKLIKMSVVDVVEIRDRKIARVWRYDNPSQIVSSP